MGQRQSKDESLYQQAIEGNVDNIKALCREGAGLEWMDKDGKTALIVASMDPTLYPVAETLIEMGANLNAYRPGPQNGTPLHHAAKGGLDQMVRLLLSHGANAFVRNDDGQTPLDVAREKLYINVVRAIEGHTCYYSGNVREILAPRFIEKLAPQLSSSKCWAVVVPCSPPHPIEPPKLELAIYHTEQDAQPLAVIPLWNSKIEDPKFRHSDPVLIVYDQSSKTRHKFGSAIVGDKQQIRRLHNACKGISQVMPPHFLSSDPPPSEASCSGWLPEPATEEYNGWALPESSTMPAVNTHPGSHSPTPSAPSLPYDDGPIHYPSIDTTPVEVSVPTIPNEAPKPTKATDSCVICWEAPVEGACIPCGHMAGCMSCLNKIKTNKGDCPVCRAKINQVVRLYAV